MPMPAFFSALPRKHQLLIIHGVPVVVAICVAVWCWSLMGTLGKVDNEVDEGNHLPAALMREQKGSIWEQIQARIKDSASYDAQIQQGPMIKKQLDALQEAIKNLNERLPTESEKSEMREVLDRLARDIPKEFGSVQIKGVSIVDNGAGRGSKEPKTVTYQVSMTGDQDGILKYIDEVERFQRFMVVARISINSGGFGMDDKTHKIIYQPHNVSMDIETKVNMAGAK
jgi:Tfp pilus assembly protein PilO